MRSSSFRRSTRRRASARWCRPCEHSASHASSSTTPAPIALRPSPRRRAPSWFGFRSTSASAAHYVPAFATQSTTVHTRSCRSTAMANTRPIRSVPCSQHLDTGGYDMVVGSRFAPGGTPSPQSGLRRAAIRVLSTTLRRRGGVSISDPTSGFRAIRDPLLSAFASDFPHHFLGDTFEAYLVAAPPRLSNCRAAGRDAGTPRRPAICGAAGLGAGDAPRPNGALHRLQLRPATTVAKLTTTRPASPQH